MRSFFLVVMCFFALACSDDDSGNEDGDGGGAASEAEQVCGSDCDRLVAVMCTRGPTRDSCMQGCFQSYGRCPAEVKAVVDCHPTYQCDPDGRPGFLDCQAENQAFQDCYN